MPTSTRTERRRKGRKTHKAERNTDRVLLGERMSAVDSVADTFPHRAIAPFVVSLRERKYDRPHFRTTTSGAVWWCFPDAKARDQFVSRHADVGAACSP